MVFVLHGFGRSSAPIRSLGAVMEADRSEQAFEQIAAVERSLEKTRARAERAAAALRKPDADEHLVEALDRGQEKLSDAARRLRQRTYFGVPEAQAGLDVD
jgi:hypothetical protein